MSRFVIVQCEQRVAVTLRCARSLIFEEWEDEEAYLEQYNWKRTTAGAYYCHEHPTDPGLNSGVRPRL